MQLAQKKITNDTLSHQRTVLMGISILLIFVFHYTEDCQSSGINYTGWVRWFRTQIGSSSVEVFLFLSGMGLYYALKRNPDVVRFYKRRLLRVLLPYLIVALPIWLVYDLYFAGKSIGAVILDVTFWTFFQSGVKLYWYIGMILFCYLIFPYLFRIVENARDEMEGEMYQLVLIASWTLFCLILKSYSEYFYKNTSIALLRLPFFMAGCFYGRSSYEKRATYWKWVVLLAAAAFLRLLTPEKAAILSRYLPGAVTLSVCALVAILFESQKLRHLAGFLNWFGNRSLELYLLHVTVRKFMNGCGYMTCYPKNELIMIALSIALAALLHACISHKRTVHTSNEQQKSC
jgi:peptidoglycan/LPS O-acetylase OafA/YrhL